MKSIRELLQGIRDGDAEAAEEFVRTYEPHVRRHVRSKLRIGRIRRVSDASDICQVVLASVLVRLSLLGRYDIDDSDAMRKLLARIADYKLIDLARRPEFRFTHLPIGETAGEELELADSGAGPGSDLALDEWIEKAKRLLTETERSIADLRKEGLSWEQIGERLNRNADACRKRLERAVDRITREMTLGGGGEG